jgi:cytochrome P450
MDDKTNQGNPALCEETGPHQAAHHPERRQLHITEDFTSDEKARVLLNLAAANRDPDAFDDPDTFNPDRSGANRHLAFGASRHLCLGQHLARAEMRTAVTALLDRLPDVRLAGPAEEGGMAGGMLMPLTAMPVTFTPA